jgi:lipid-binding SYLF domain-containing protein
MLKSILILLSIAALTGARIAQAASVDADARAALSALYEKSPAAKALGEKAKGILVFPQIGKVAVLVGAQSGQGAMFTDGEIAGHYRVDGVLVGLEAGGQSYAYAMFLMSDKALETLRKTHGFEIGADPNIVVLNAGAGKEVSTSTAQADVYGYVFNQSGLMGGVALQGLKITEVGK